MGLIVRSEQAKPWLLLSAKAVSEASAAAKKLSTVERSRVTAAISHARLAAASDVDLRWLFRVLREPDRATPALVAKLEAGLRRLQGDARAPSAQALMLSTYGGFLAVIARHYDVTPAAVRESDPQRGATADKHWQRCAHARQAAIYLTHTLLGLPQRHLATVLGLTPAAVCLACKAVEERRTDTAFDAALIAANRDVMGGNER